MSTPAERVLSEVVSMPDEKLWVECFNCKVPCHHVIVASAEVEWSVVSGSVRERAVHQLIQCGGCRKIGYRELQVLSNADEPESAVTLEELFPRREDRAKRARKYMDNLKYVPKRPQAIYIETLRAYNSDQPVLTGVGIRAVVECVCKHKRVTGGDLQKKIDALGTAGFLSRNEVKLTHRLRFLGNRAAHEGDPPSRDDLDAGMNITEHLLRAVYVAPKMARELPIKSRRKQ